MTSPRTLAAAAACALLLASGCGEGDKVGKGVDLTASPGATGGLFPTTAPPKPGATKSAKPKPTATKAATQAATTRPPTKRPTQAPPPTFVVTLNGDKSGKALIDPPQVSVFTGTPITWKNADTKPHGVVASNGAFNSGPCNPNAGVTSTCIQPGKSYTWIAGAPGSYAYKDSSRPYVNAQLMVSPR